MIFDHEKSPLWGMLKCDRHMKHLFIDHLCRNIPQLNDKTEIRIGRIGRYLFVRVPDTFGNMNKHPPPATSYRVTEKKVRSGNYRHSLNFPIFNPPAKDKIRTVRFVERTTVERFPISRDREIRLEYYDIGYYNERCHLMAGYDGLNDVLYVKHMREM